ncbi:MAG TPA: hypothetical protein VF665_03385 [Longimicrobium sp.]|jgi:hypothetical protein|uniref:hypothetical protein n=1 Tax=Longimicrobium sp. TaxID=2029185 RepID=UPI002EDA456C
MKIVRLVSLFLPLIALVLLPRALAAQQPAPLENFVANIARLWSRGDADAIVALAPEDGRIVLDLAGDGPGEVQERHASAALRGLFAERENVSVRPRQVTISGGSPVRGFGELTWVARPRGVSDTLSSIVYVGAVWEDGAWRLRELRVLR